MQRLCLIPMVLPCNMPSCWKIPAGSLEDIQILHFSYPVYFYEVYYMLTPGKAATLLVITTSFRSHFPMARARVTTAEESCQEPPPCFSRYEPQGHF